MSASWSRTFANKIRLASTHSALTFVEKTPAIWLTTLLILVRVRKATQEHVSLHQQLACFRLVQTGQKSDYLHENRILGIRIL